MAVRNIFKSLAGSAPDSDSPVAQGTILPGDTARRMQVLDDFEQAGIGWIWASDPDGRHGDCHCRQCS